MARLFDDASLQYLENTSAIATAAPITMAAWAYTDDATISENVLGIGGNGTVNSFRLNFGGATAGDPIRAISAEAGVFAIAVTTTGFSANTWHQVCVVFAAADDRRAFIDGGSKGTNATTNTPGSLSYTQIATVREASSQGGYFSGSIAEAAIWNIALSDEEIALLAKGFSPLFFRPQSLLAYWPLVRTDDNDRFGRANMTAVNAPTVADHPPKIIYPAPVLISYPSAAAPAELEGPLVWGKLLRGGVLSRRLVG